MLALYRLATDLGAPAINLILARRRARGREDPDRLAERRGVAGLARPEGPLVWLHGASVGEALSALPLIERVLAGRDPLQVLVTTGTVTSAGLLAERLPGRAFHQYVPVDRAPWVRRFLDHWRPDAALWMESELWPNLILETAGRGVPMILVNGRMSDRSFRKWSARPRTARRLLGCFTLCLAQSEEDRRRFADLGADPVSCPGNLKFAAPPLPCDEGDLKTLRGAVGKRPRWLAASTHPGEEEMVAAAHKTLAQRHEDVLTIIVPRHPERGAEVARRLAEAGVALARRGAGQAVGAETGVYLADTMGELGLFYRLADIVFVGGSLVGHGGQNPLEPAQLDCAILHGPHMHNFRVIAADLLAAGGAAEVTNTQTLARAVDRLLREPDTRRALAAGARSAAAKQAGVLDRVAGAVLPFLPGQPPVRSPRPSRAKAAPKRAAGAPGKPRARA